MNVKMRKQRPPPHDTRLPEPLNFFAKRIGNGNGDTSMEALKQLLMAPLMQQQCQPEFFPPFTNLNKSDRTQDADGKIKKSSEDHSQNDTETLQKEYNDEENTVERGKEEIRCLCSLMDQLELSFDGEWLRKYLELPLKMAMKEIIAKKPYDPVSYLGFWLLNYKKFQENTHWQLQKQQELHYIRSLIQEPICVDEEHVSVGRGEEEEETRDWNFKYYESWHTPM